MWIERQSEKKISSGMNDITALEFTSDKIRKLAEHVRGIRQDLGKLRYFFERMGRQLEDEKNQLHLIHLEMNITTVDYVKDEEEK